MQVCVPLGDFHGHHAATDRTAKESSVEEGLQALALGFGANRHDPLATVEQFFRYQGIVYAVVEFALEQECAVVDGVLKHPLCGRGRDVGAMDATHTSGSQHERNLFQRVFAGSELLERTSDMRGNRWFPHKLLPLGVGVVAEYRWARPNTLGGFATLSTPDVLRQTIDVIFGLREHHGQHHLTGRRVLKGEGRKSQFADTAGVEEVDDATTVERVPCQAVGMPCQNALCFAPFNAVEHLIEHRASGSFGGQLLGQHLSHVDIASLGKFPEFQFLISNRANLTRGVVGRFPQIHEECGDW